MKMMLAATAALSVLALAPAASAQSQYGPGPDSSAYAGQDDYDSQADGPDGYADQDGADADGYGQPAYGQPQYGQPGSGQRPGYGQPAPHGPAAGNHYPTYGYPRVQPDPNGPPDGYAGEMPDNDDMDDSDYGDGGSAYPTDGGGYAGAAGGYNTNPSHPAYGPAPYGADIPADLLAREDRLERQIRHTDRRGNAPDYATDNLMIVLNSIRDQQAELAARDNGLNFTDRRFIEARLNRLEQQVRALR